MNRVSRRILSLLTSAAMLLSVTACSGAEQESVSSEQPVESSSEASVSEEPVYRQTDDICIVYTNDVHCGIEGDIGYKGVSLIAESLRTADKTVLLVDSGDAIQGGTEGSFTNGSAPIDIMNSLGYLAMCPGNHEFDYGIPRLLELAEAAEFPIVCCNFTGPDGELVFDPYVIVEADGMKIAFVGVATPGTLTSSTPAFFQDENGEFVYSFGEDGTGEKLAGMVSDAAAAARAEGADYVVALAHLGAEASCSPYTSSELVPMISGLDVLLDGHSHTVMECEKVKDKDGKTVLISQTGSYLQNVGLLTIHPDGSMETELISNDEIADAVDSVEEELAEITEQTVAETSVDLCICDPANPEQRLVRLTETNVADLCADAFRDYTGADIALVNGGGIRVDLPAGEITYGDILSLMPFGNTVSVISASGQQILDALECSVSRYPSENGGFLQVSGITFDLDVSIDSPVLFDDQNFMAAIEGERRVSNVKIGGEELDPEKMYTVCGPYYVLIGSGDGNTAFKGCEVLQDEGILDQQVLIRYITETLGGVVGEQYADPYGDGRINFVK